MSFQIDQFLEQVKQTTASSFENEADRITARNATSALLSRLRSPWENTFHYAWHGPAVLGCLKLCADLNLFEKWASKDAGKKSPMSADELAHIVDVDPGLLNRILRFLATMQVLETKERDMYVMTPWATSLATPVYHHIINFTYDINMNGFHNLPKFLKSVDYQNPSDPAVNNFSHLFGKSLWALFQEKPSMAVDFQNTMTEYAKSKAPWTSVYPAANLFENLKPDRAILVDIGGGQGGDISLLANASSSQNLPNGSLVLEDLPDVVTQANVPEPVKKLAYNAFEEQPIKGARAYYMHIVLHDFPNVDAIKILKRQAEAMERGYSKLLLYETVIGAENPSEAATTMVSDLTMMMVFSSGERTYETWTSVLGEAGLKIVKVHNSTLASESIIEAELA